MVSIKETCEVSASTDQVWEIVSDVDRDSEYWSGMNSIQNISKEGNVIEREVTVGFIGSKGLQRIKLNPKDSIELKLIKGPLKGSREIRLTPLRGGKRTRLDVSWDFQFAGVPTFARAFVKSQLETVTKEALARITKVAEGKRQPSHRSIRRKK